MYTVRKTESRKSFADSRFLFFLFKKKKRSIIQRYPALIEERLFSETFCQNIYMWKSYAICCISVIMMAAMATVNQANWQHPETEGGRVKEPKETEIEIWWRERERKRKCSKPGNMFALHAQASNTHLLIQLCFHQVKLGNGQRCFYLTGLKNRVRTD